MISSNMGHSKLQIVGYAILGDLKVFLSLSLVCQGKISIKCSSLDKCGIKLRFKLGESILLHSMGYQTSRFLKGGVSSNGLWHGGITTGRGSTAKLGELSRGERLESGEGSDPNS